ncbi:Syntaxin-binding protein 5 [Varanus komodoensis]|nr:Syntaxin-binding protein 5 [Varanus komodoensis]
MRMPHRCSIEFRSGEMRGQSITFTLSFFSKAVVVLEVKDGKKPEPCKPILKVEYKTTRAGEPFIILSGGLSYDTVGRRPCLTVMHGKSTAVLEMDYSIVDFLTLCETPYPNDFQEPYAVVVLLEKDLVLIDLAQIGYPIFENPYPLSIHESPVTCCEYFADCPVDLIPALYSVGARQKRQGYSKKEWPINGGNWGLVTQSYPEIIITGHADGSIKFWDASAITLQVLYKLKTAKVFEKSRNKDDRPSTDIVDEDPYAIQIISWCPESRMLCIAGVSAHVIVYRFSKQEITTEVIPMLEVRLLYEINYIESPDPEQVPPLPTPSTGSNPQPIAPQSHPSTSSSSSDGLRDNVPCLKVKNSSLKQSPGYQVELVIQLVWVSGEPPQQITSLAINSAYGLVVFGNCNGIAMVDYIQKTTLLNLGTIELYGSNDPYRREPRSPRKSRQPSGGMLAVASCMCGFSSLYSESVKKLRTSYIIVKAQTFKSVLVKEEEKGESKSQSFLIPTPLKSVQVFVISMKVQQYKRIVASLPPQVVIGAHMECLSANLTVGPAIEAAATAGAIEREGNLVTASIRPTDWNTAMAISGIQGGKGIGSDR